MARGRAPDESIRLDFRPLRQLRRLLDIPQRTLAARAGVHRNAISYWERGHRVPTVLELARVSRILGTPPWELFDVLDAEGAPVSKPWRGVGR